jgi:ABC-type uncharacterized transport system substrate-binding protein
VRHARSPSPGLLTEKLFHNHRDTALRYAEGKLERLPDLAAELVQLKMDVMVTFDTNAALAAKNATSTIPIVSLSGDPARAGLVTNLVS